MRPWYEVVEPAREIREGQVDESTFAASLADVRAGRAALEYRDASLFFSKTYPTKGMTRLLAAVAARLAGAGWGEPVIQIQTPFGGGKTHSLVALYHLFCEPNAVATGRLQSVLQEANLDALPAARVIVFDGTAADPLGRTPWGEIAEQLGRFDLLREYDEKRITPGTERLRQVLEGQPTLILMDEIAEYAIKAKTFRDQVMAFFQELTETVKSLPHCSLVATLPSSVPYGEEGERALSQLQRIFGRVEAIYTPVEGIEVYEVIRRRLFSQMGDGSNAAWMSTAQQVAEAYWQMYQQLGADIPTEAREPAYREKMRLAYPFHPQVIDVLNERWGTYPTFQRTRGVLRLLANVVADLWQRKYPAPLIQAAHINLARPEIRREFLKHIGNEYEGVIAADIVDTNARAQRIDKEIGSEYAIYNVASGLATAIFFGSFSGAERRGVTAPFLRLALLREGIPPALVGDALGRMKEDLWYLHEEGGLYQFRNQPNLNRVLLEHEEAVTEEAIAQEVEARLRVMAGGEMRVTLYPRGPEDIPDNRELKLAILSGDLAPTALNALVKDLLDRAATTYRVYKNTLFILAPDSGEIANVKQQVRRLLALRNVQHDRGLLDTLPAETKATLTTRAKEAEGQADFLLRCAYRHLYRMGAEAVEQRLDLGLPTVNERGSLANRVKDFLRDQEILLSRIAPRHLVEKAMAPNEREKDVREIYEAFLRYPHLPVLEGPGALYEAVRKGVDEGTFGARLGGQIYFRKLLPNFSLEDGVSLVRAEVAEAEARATESEQGSEPQGEKLPPAISTREADSVNPPPPVQKVRRLVLRARVPALRISDLLRGVIMPLHDDGATLQLEIHVVAESSEGIKHETLEQKVEETLRQLGAEILEDCRE